MKLKMKRLFSLIIILIVILSSCGSNSSDSLAGVYNVTPGLVNALTPNNSNGPDLLTLAKDGTGTCCTKDNKNGFQFKWSLDNNKLFITIETGETISANLEKGSKFITLHFNLQQLSSIEFVLEKIDSAPESAPIIENNNDQSYEPNDNPENNNNQSSETNDNPENNNSSDIYETLIKIDTTLDPNEIKIEHIEGNGFSAVMMIVNDPSRVFVGTTYNNGQWGEYGLELNGIVQKYNAKGGINAGIYAADFNKGGHPYGPVVSNGEIQHMGELDFEGLVLIAMSEDNILKIIDINGKEEAEVRQIITDERIRDAVVFQEDSSDVNNHFVKLIINGIRREMNGIGSGWNPRTAIGQTADGRILLLTTDGRGIKNHIGANASDLIDIMCSYGAVNAANLDGGSASSMFYNGEWLQNSVTFGMVSSSWRLPTAFIVR